MASTDRDASYEHLHLSRALDGRVVGLRFEHGKANEVGSGVLGEAGTATAGAEHIIRSRHDRQSASRAMSDWLSLPDRPRAVFAATDELAFGALHAAGKLGLRIPEDLAIISFDGVFETATMAARKTVTVGLVERPPQLSSWCCDLEF